MPFKVPFSEFVSLASIAKACKGSIVIVIITTSINERNFLKLKLLIVCSPFHKIYLYKARRWWNRRGVIYCKN